MTHHGKSLISTGPAKDALHFVSDRLYVRGWTKGVEAFLELPPKGGTSLARKTLNPAERKVGILFVNTGFYVPLLADLLARHADELPEQLRLHRTEIEQFLGKEFVATLERDLAKRARQQPEKLVVGVAELLFDKLSEQNDFLATLRPFLSTRSLVLDTDVSGVWQLDLMLRLNNDRQAAAARMALQAGRKLLRVYWQTGRDAVAAAVKDPRSRAKFIASLQSLQKNTAGMLGGTLQDPEQLLKILDWFGEMLDNELVIDGTGAAVHAGFRTRGENFANAASLFLAAMLEGVQKVKAAALRTQSQNNLKMIGLSMHDYAGDHNSCFPSAAICSKEGKPLLSWRVVLLPYLEQNDLYKQFKLDEAWDSPHNKKLLTKMPKLYAVPGEECAGRDLTYYQVFVGREAPFQGFRFGPRLPATFQDGTSNTILVVEAGEAVPWTKPVDLPFAADKPLPKLGGVRPTAPVFFVVFADGSVRALPRTIPEKTLRALITPNGGEVIDWETIEGSPKRPAPKLPANRKMREQPGEPGALATGGGRTPVAHAPGSSVKVRRTKGCARSLYSLDCWRGWLRAAPSGAERPPVPASGVPGRTPGQKPGQPVGRHPRVREGGDPRKESLGREERQHRHALRRPGQALSRHRPLQPGRRPPAEAVRLGEGIYGADHPRLAAALESLATAAFHTGQYARVEPLYECALAIRGACHGKDHLDVADTLAALASFHQAVGNYARAEPLFLRGALDIREKKDGPEASLHRPGRSTTSPGCTPSAASTTRPNRSSSGVSKSANRPSRLARTFSICRTSPPPSRTWPASTGPKAASARPRPSSKIA